MCVGDRNVTRFSHLTLCLGSVCCRYSKRPLFSGVQTGFAGPKSSYSMGTYDPFLGVMRPGREADHLPPSIAVSIKDISCASTVKPQHCNA